MMTEPKLEQREEQRYVGIRTRVAVKDIGTVMPALHREVNAWLGRQSVAPSGPPFFRYLVIDMEKEMEMEGGVPIASALAGEGRIQADILPAGRYATLIHTGHYD